MELKIETQFGVATVNVPREKALEIIKCAFELAAEPKEAVIPLKRMERILGGIVIQTDEEKNSGGRGHETERKTYEKR